MSGIRSLRALLRLAGSCAAAAALSATGGGIAEANGGVPVVQIDGGAVRGAPVGGTLAFRGLPYAAAPVGSLRWRPPQAVARWRGVRDASDFAPSCLQPPSPFQPAGAMSEDCLYLNVSTTSLRGHRPVLVWIHGGGLNLDAARSYDATKLAEDGTVAVTVDYRLGALGFLAHPALAARDGSAGNYGLMDQQAALRWVQRNIAQFGGDPRNVTIAGQSAGGLSVLAQLVSPGARGLFQRAIVQSGAFALRQQTLADAEADGERIAAAVHCTDQSARCLRAASATDLISQPAVWIPGVVDGDVLHESVGSAIAAGRFAHVPILDGSVDGEEVLFTAIGNLVSNGGNVTLPDGPVTADNYLEDIETVLGVSAGRGAAIAAEYPLSAYPNAFIAFAALMGDSQFSCTALQLDRWTSARVPTYAYEFNDDSAPDRFVGGGLLPPVATHGWELQYLFDLPSAPVAATLNPDQQQLASSMRAAWASFAAIGRPFGWPAFNGSLMTSLVPPRPQLETNFAAKHHCGFWKGATHA